MDIRDILTAVVEKNASDLILLEGNPPSFIVNGTLYFLDQKPLTKNDLKIILDEIVDDNQKKQKFFNDKELNFAYELEGKARFRVNAYFQKNSIAFSIRIIPLTIPKLEDLNLPDVIKEFTKRQSGLILIIGPSKSGKSSTVAAMVDLINEDRALHIVTIEDPIEYMYKSKKCIISQREVNEDTNSFADALRHVLRQNSSVIVVDGLRDKESGKMILEAAETGHLVLCTLHTWNIVQSINKFVDLFPESEKKQIRIQIAQTLKGVISQRLLRRTDGKGLICACEVTKIDHTLENFIRDDKLHQLGVVMSDLRKEGMITMNEVFTSLYKKGLVDVEEIVEQTSGKQGFLETFNLR